jgi:hypothetical protein
MHCWNLANASGIYVLGESDSALPGQTHAGGLRYFVRKYDANGTELWTRSLWTSGLNSRRHRGGCERRVLNRSHLRGITGTNQRLWLRCFRAQV